MKRILAIILSTVILASCSSVPRGWDKETYEIAKEALTWCERYDDGKINDDEFSKQMSKLGEKAEKINPTDQKESFNNGLIVLDLQFLSMTYMGKDYFYEQYDRLKGRFE